MAKQGTPVGARQCATLDHLCDQAVVGNQVVFCAKQGNSQQQSTKNGKKTPTTITTSDREELKNWMKTMEGEGKTVIVTYDDRTGQWNGRAYTSLSPNASQSEVQDYSGELVFIPTPIMHDSPIGGLVWSMQVEPDSLLVITVEGTMLWFDSDTVDSTMEMLEGQSTLRGVVSMQTCANGDSFMTLELEIPESGIIEF